MKMVLQLRLSRSHLVNARKRFLWYGIWYSTYRYRIGRWESLNAYPCFCKISRRFEDAGTTGPCSNLLLAFIYWRWMCPILQVPRLVSHPKLYQELERVGLVNPTPEFPYFYVRSTIHFCHLLFVITSTFKAMFRTRPELSDLKTWVEDKAAQWFLRITFVISRPFKIC